MLNMKEIETEQIKQKKATHLCKKIQSKTAKINELAVLRDMAEDECDYDKVGSISLELVKTIYSLRNIIKTDFFEKGSEKSYYKLLESTVDCKGSRSGRVYTYIFDKLLPYRSVLEKGMVKGYLEDINCFKASLAKAIEETKPEMFNERAVVKIIHHFSDIRRVKDYDNTESKAVLDVMKIYFLKDDNPAYMSIYFDYMLDSSDFTEIVILPETEFFQK